MLKAESRNMGERPMGTTQDFLKFAEEESYLYVGQFQFFRYAR